MNEQTTASLLNEYLPCMLYLLVHISFCVLKAVKALLNENVVFLYYIPFIINYRQNITHNI